MRDDPAREPRSAPGRRPRQRYGAAMKVVRRAHMYLGLLVFPWILLFGISGVLFNHPQIGRDFERREISAEQIAALTAFRPWDPDALARQVVEQLNAGSPARYTLDEGTPGSFSGWPELTGSTRDGGRTMLLISLDDGDATLSTFPPGPGKPPDPPFAGAKIDLPEHRMAAVEEQVKELLPGLGVEGAGPLRAHPEVSPELRFRVRDADARAWNVTYDLGSGRLDGRPDDAPAQLRFVELLGNLHKTHHFPVHGGMTWVWALFADITGITLVLWALSGLAMWWQMKPSRVIGAVAIAVAVAVAAVVMSGTASDILFGKVEKGGA
ncbi:PepSY domain-containing protein [Sorangium sp. So ce1153]|uniref:PepSY domain-containing protein n=1 Tax=Sorangium sp. So ce1153 TaxID=3133333 RepID=UPI003F6447F9